MYMYIKVKVAMVLIAEYSTWNTFTVDPRDLDFRGVLNSEVLYTIKYNYFRGVHNVLYPINACL